MSSDSQHPLQGSSKELNAQQVDHALVHLCAAVLPVWGRQLATSRSQSEAAVAEMLAAFAEIGPHLNMAARQSAQISKALVQGEGGIAELSKACEHELSPLLPGLDASAAAGVRRVMDMIAQSVQALEKVARPFEKETQLVGAQVERMYIGFQYQDRISQMMTLLHEDIQRLISLMTTPELDVKDLAPEAWLARLESQYAMQEQRDGHTNVQCAAIAPDVGDDATFFNRMKHGTNNIGG